ncbi:hypothetical protein BT63DRAFT_457319 [Microthyrium microscopicum]|uniref:DUF7730 domain-containing protein n=1 Tax=Microthyrium microscopicum TaxID=703497 RepID=A0A6A6UA62_9PEZI|nr:hypothetical protein BT63DRAFT_457319 [Microthyrium microscopicum]
MRLMIYEHLLVSQETFGFSPALDSGDNRRRDNSQFIVPELLINDTSPQILCTCRQVYEEAREILYRRNIFRLSVPGDLSPSLKYSSQISADHRSLITHLNITMTAWDHTERLSDEVFRCLANNFLNAGYIDCDYVWPYRSSNHEYPWWFTPTCTSSRRVRPSTRPPSKEEAMLKCTQNIGRLPQIKRLRCKFPVCLLLPTVCIEETVRRDTDLEWDYWYSRATMSSRTSDLVNSAEQQSQGEAHAGKSSTEKIDNGTPTIKTSTKQDEENDAARRVVQDFTPHRKLMHLIQKKAREEGLLVDVPLTWRFHTITRFNESPCLFIVMILNDKDDHITCQVDGDYSVMTRRECL